MDRIGNRIDINALYFSATGREILNGIDLAIAAGERVGIIGPNGSGKSTLLRCLYAWYRPTSGVVRLDDADLIAMPARQRAQSVAVLAQQSESGIGLSVGEVVALGRAPHRGAWSAEHGDDASAVEQALAAVGLDQWRNRLFAPLSGGEKQRVLFARALAQRPTLLILDELANHLDIRHQLEVFEVARGLGITVVATMHDLNMAAHWCDRLCLLDRGRVQAVGTPDEVLDPVLIGSAYGVLVDRDRNPRTGHPRLSFHLATPKPRSSP